MFPNIDNPFHQARTLDVMRLATLFLFATAIVLQASETETPAPAKEPAKELKKDAATRVPAG